MEHTVLRIAFHVLSVCFACLMLSSIPYPDLSVVRVERKHVFQYNVIMVLILCVAVLRFKIVLTLLAGTFILAGPIYAIRDYARPRPADSPSVSSKDDSVEKSPFSDSNDRPTL